MPVRNNLKFWQNATQALLWLGVVLIIVGSKLWLISRYGSGLPYWDQLDAEGEFLLRPLIENGFDWRIFFAPHNEHRIVFTKFIAWLLWKVNQQWDANVQMVLNAFIHASLLPVILLWAKQSFRGWQFAVFSVIGVLLWALPTNWENTLRGFQSQFYFLLWFTFLHLWGVLSAKAWGWRWAGGQVSGFLALGAMGSGVFSSAAIVGVVSWQAIRRRSLTKFQATTLVCSFVFIIVAWSVRHPVPGHEILKAESVYQFLASFWTIASWPYNPFFVWSLPLSGLVLARVVFLMTRSELSAFDRTYLGLALWLGLVFVFTAYLRANSSVLTPRYFDQYFIGLLLQGIALASFSRGAWSRTLIPIWAICLILSLIGLVQRTEKVTLANRAANVHMQEKYIRDYLATGDTEPLRQAHKDHMVYPSAEVLISHWTHQSIQDILPAVVRRSIDVKPKQIESTTNLPPTTYPVVAASPLGPQTKPWVWRSDTFPDTTLPILRFRFSGALGDPQAAIHMRLMSELTEVEVVPDGPARERWKSINVIRPSGEWWIEIEDSDGIDRISLTAPVELGWLSWGSEKMIKHHLWFVVAGAVVVLGTMIGRATMIYTSKSCSAPSAGSC